MTGKKDFEKSMEDIRKEICLVIKLSVREYDKLTNLIYVYNRDNETRISKEDYMKCILLKKIDYNKRIEALKLEIKELKKVK